MQMYNHDYSTRLYNTCIRSSNTFRHLTEILMMLKNGGDIMSGNYNEPINKLVSKLNVTLTQMNPKLNLSREQIHNTMVKHSRIFTQLILEYFIAACQTLKTMKTTPDARQLKMFMDNVVFLHNNGYLSDVWGHFEGFIKVAIMAIRENGVIDDNDYNMDLHHLLSTIGCTERTGVMIVVQLETVIESFLTYMIDSNVNPSPEETETLTMVVVTMNEVLEYNHRVRMVGGMHIFKKLSATMRRLKLILSNHFIIAEIELCLGLLPF